MLASYFATGRNFFTDNVGTGAWGGGGVTGTGPGGEGVEGGLDRMGGKTDWAGKTTQGLGWGLDRDWQGRRGGGGTRLWPS